MTSDTPNTDDELTLNTEQPDEYNPMTSERRVREVLIELQEADPTSKYNKIDASKAYSIIWKLWGKHVNTLHSPEINDKEKV